MTIQNAMLEDARIIFRNFKGEGGQYNREGNRHFNVILPDDVGKQMLKDGWNVRTLKARNEEDQDEMTVEVTVGYKGRPPRVVMITSRGRTNLDEDTVELLDWADIETADMILRPYEWEVNGKTGIKAYLQSLYVTIREDELERKYADVPIQGHSIVDPPWEDEDE